MAGAAADPSEKASREAWEPLFAKSAGDYFRYLIGDKFAGADFQLNEELCTNIGNFLRRQGPLPEDENFNPSEIADGPVYQHACYGLLTWRGLTIRDEAERCGIILPKEEGKPKLTHDIEDILQWTSDPRFEDPLLFTLIQARREEFFQGYFNELGQYLFFKKIGEPEFGKFKKQFSRRAFPDLVAIEEHISINQPLLNNNELIEEIAKSLNPSNSDQKTEATKALQLFFYLKEVFPQREDSDLTRGIAQGLICLHSLIASHQPTGNLGVALKRLGIPDNEEMRNLDVISPESILNLANYIGKYFSDMNLTHNR